MSCTVSITIRNGNCGSPPINAIGMREVDAKCILSVHREAHHLNNRTFCLIGLLDISIIAGCCQRAGDKMLLR